MYVIGTVPNAAKLIKNFRGTNVGKVVKLSGMNKAQRLLYQTGEIAKPIVRRSNRRNSYIHRGWYF